MRAADAREPDTGYLRMMMRARVTEDFYPAVVILRIIGETLH
jgi:hypothetical protein